MDDQHTGFPKYIGDGECYAAKITFVETRDFPEMPGCLFVLLGDVGKEMTVMPKWARENNPEVGGYFVIRNGIVGAQFIPAGDFESRFTKVGE